MPKVTIPLPFWSTLFTSMFLHGGWMHLAGNMLYLWILGDNLEKVIQMLNPLGSLATTSETGGVAYMAHIGGFVAGMVLVKVMTAGARPVAA